MAEYDRDSTLDRAISSSEEIGHDSEREERLASAYKVMPSPKISALGAL